MLDLVNFRKTSLPIIKEMQNAFDEMLSLCRDRDGSLGQEEFDRKFRNLFSIVSLRSAELSALLDASDTYSWVCTYKADLRNFLSFNGVRELLNFQKVSSLRGSSVTECFTYLDTLIGLYRSFGLLPSSPLDRGPRWIFTRTLFSDTFGIMYGASIIANIASVVRENRKILRRAGCNIKRLFSIVASLNSGPRHKDMQYLRSCVSLLHGVEKPVHEFDAKMDLKPAGTTSCETAQKVLAIVRESFKGRWFAPREVTTVIGPDSSKTVQNVLRGAVPTYLEVKGKGAGRKYKLR